MCCAWLIQRYYKKKWLRVLLVIIIEKKKITHSASSLEKCYMGLKVITVIITAI